MKILLLGPYYANGKHGAEVGIYEALMEMGHDVSVWDYRYKTYQEKDNLLEGNFDPNRDDFNNKITLYDLVICPGPGLPTPIVESKFFQSITAIKVNWNSEPIRLPQYFNKFKAQADQYDYVFTFDDTEVPIYKKAFGLDKVFWLPQGYNPQWYKPLDKTCSVACCFVGSIGGKWINREIFIKRVAKSFPVNLAQAIFDAEKVNEVYSNFALVLNLGLHHPTLGEPSNLKSFALQQRVFESIGAGKVCVTNEIPGEASKLLKDKETVLYYNEDNLEDVIMYGLKNYKTMEKNILSIRSEHTYKARMNQMLQVIDV